MLVRLANHTNEKDGYTYVSLTKVGREIGVKFRQAINLRQELVQSEELRIEHVSGRCSHQYVTTQDPCIPVHDSRATDCTTPVHSTAPYPLSEPEREEEEPPASFHSAESAPHNNADNKSESSREELNQGVLPPAPRARPPRKRGEGNQDDPRFEAFWMLYPRKCLKLKALKAWHETLKKHGEGVIDAIMAVLPKAIASREWKDEDGRFIPGPEKFLREERWMNTYTEPGRKITLRSVL